MPAVVVAVNVTGAFRAGVAVDAATVTLSGVCATTVITVDVVTRSPLLSVTVATTE